MGSWFEKTMNKAGDQSGDYLSQAADKRIAEQQKIAPSASPVKQQGSPAGDPPGSREAFARYLKKNDQKARDEEQNQVDTQAEDAMKQGYRKYSK